MRRCRKILCGLAAATAGLSLLAGPALAVSNEGVYFDENRSPRIVGTAQPDSQVAYDVLGDDGQVLQQFSVDADSSGRFDHVLMASRGDVSPNAISSFRAQDGTGLSESQAHDAYVGAWQAYKDVRDGVNNDGSIAWAWPDADSGSAVPRSGELADIGGGWLAATGYGPYGQAILKLSTGDSLSIGDAGLVVASVDRFDGTPTRSQAEGDLGDDGVFLLTSDPDTGEAVVARCDVVSGSVPAEDGQFASSGRSDSPASSAVPAKASSMRMLNSAAVDGTTAI